MTIAYLASLSSEDEVAKTSSHSTSKQSRFYYKMVVISRGAVIKLWITELPVYPEGMNLKNKKSRTKRKSRTNPTCPSL